ncbi:unnamed protein product [Brassicogethes aeneus]|uniref:Uncharacterized protein n=1 Tax=Brassicogethes aeneus TaxID=1431903 RepID=A0A9P0B3C3_BRAAE|nr:unnamed protein product [Brassicogethes aeneus]
MKFNILLIFGLVCLIGSSLARPVDEEINQENDPEAEAPKKPARPLIGRRPLAGRNNKPTSSTTTTAAPQEEEEPVEEAEYEDEEIQTSSTTEAPKKGLFKGGVRPFRSNDDLLATLKRRREQAVSNKSHVKVQSEPEQEAPIEPVTKASKTNGRRNRFSKDKSEAPAGAAEESPSTATSPVRTGRRFNVRN